MNKNQKIVLIFGFGGILAYFATRQTGQFLPVITDIVKAAQNEVSIMTTGQTCGERNNNPGNIRPAGYTWQGQTGTAECGSSGTFIVFSSPEYGIRAIAKDLRTKFGRGLNTIRKIITVYAPPSENNTDAYIQAVSASVGALPDSPLDLNDSTTLIHFVYAIIQHENGRIIYTPAQIAEGVSMALG